MYFDPIAKVDLSTRSYNALYQANVRTIGALLKLDYTQMLGIRNLGAKCTNEIEFLQKEIRSGVRYKLVDANSAEIANIRQVETIPVFLDTSGTPRKDIPLKQLGLSYRANRILTEAGYDFTSKLLGVTSEQLLALPNMGKGSAEEVLSKIANVEFEKVRPNSPENMLAEKYCMKFVSSLINHLPVQTGEACQALLPYFKNALENDETISKDILFTTSVLRNAVINKIITALEKSSFGVSREDLIVLFSDSPVPEHIVNEILRELSAAGKIYIGQTIEIIRPNLWEYIDTIQNDKHREMFRLRLQGKTLEEISVLFGGITRERVRQITKKCMDKKRVVIEEDKYQEIYKTYSFSKEEFLLAFNTDESVYIYMTLVCDKAGSLSTEQFLEDANYPAELRKGAERVVYKNYFTIGDVRVLKRRPELADYVCRTYFQDEATFDAFVEMYNTVLQNLGIANDSQFILNKASYENRFSETSNVLWKYKSRFRYYDMSGRDFDALLDNLHLEQYTDVEYSSLKFFRSYPELMKEYDLRDEYELHNLLRKIYAKKETGNISFSRMPIIEFGKADRDKQVLDLLIHLAPISVKKFCEAYEEEYGVLARTVAGSFISCIDQYRDRNDIYDISAEPLTAEQMIRMQEILRDDYYDIPFILQCYHREFPTANPSMINSYTLKSMGFITLSSCVIRSSFASAAEYFKHILTREDIIDANSFPTTLTSQGSYANELCNLKSRYEIIEFEPQRYINRRRLESLGVTIQDINDYCDKVSEFVQPKTYFTIHSLRRQGFSHSLDSLDFDDWFYASIVAEDKERYCYQRMGGTKVLCQGVRQITMEILFKNIIDQHNGIDIDDFIELLKEKYDIKIARHKIVDVIKSSAMYYDQIEKRIAL